MYRVFYAVWTRGCSFISLFLFYLAGTKVEIISKSCATTLESRRLVCSVLQHLQCVRFSMYHLIISRWQQSDYLQINLLYYLRSLCLLFCKTAWSTKLVLTGQVVWFHGFREVLATFPAVQTAQTSKPSQDGFQQVYCLKWSQK